ncbi:MAG: hypothetical protein ACFB6S_12160 [Geminicoccaceae bacterium]
MVFCRSRTLSFQLMPALLAMVFLLATAAGARVPTDQMFDRPVVKGPVSPMIGQTDVRAVTLAL